MIINQYYDDGDKSMVIDVVINNNDTKDDIMSIIELFVYDSASQDDEPNICNIRNDYFRIYLEANKDAKDNSYFTVNVYPVDKDKPDSYETYLEFVLDVKCMSLKKIAKQIYNTLQLTLKFYNSIKRSPKKLDEIL